MACCSYHDGQAKLVAFVANGCDLADAIEKLFGYGICIVTICKPGMDGVYIDKRFPTWEKAWNYGRELLQ